MKIRDLVIATCTNVAEEHSAKLASLNDDLPLLDSGLDSLCLAVIVARLEDRLGFDPFDNDDEIDFPVTLGEFIRVYENANETGSAGR
jgi:acyl carrier protein